MSYKPDESTLISWMYGDLEGAERARVDAYFAEHPDELKAVRQLQSVRDVMGHAGDKEVIAPPLIMDDSPRVVSLWNTSWFRAAASIAASFLLILVAGKLLGPEIRVANGELRISFSDKPVEDVRMPVQESLTPAQVQALIDASVKGNEQRIEQLATNQVKLDETVRRSLQASPSEHLDTLVHQMSKASEEQIRMFVAGLREENLQMMRQYLALSASEQRTYMENLLVDFSKWQQEQRSQDILLFQARVNNIEQNTNQLKEETEQILATLIATGGISEKNSN
jgi:hypothetical protein